jgi:hypothetical protein
MQVGKVFIFVSMTGNNDAGKIQNSDRKKFKVCNTGKK